jgi:hypothetical protein
MVLESFFAAQLAGILGDYVDGVTPEALDLRIGLRSGSAELVNLRIKQGVSVGDVFGGPPFTDSFVSNSCCCNRTLSRPHSPFFSLSPAHPPHLLLVHQALDKLEIPFIVRVGVIEKITLTTPAYSSLLRMTGEPVVIKISGVYLLVDKSVQTPEEVRRLCAPHPA